MGFVLRVIAMQQLLPCFQLHSTISTDIGKSVMHADKTKAISTVDKTTSTLLHWVLTSGKW